jgi:hypothetical protein
LEKPTAICRKDTPTSNTDMKMKRDSDFKAILSLLIRLKVQGKLSDSEFDKVVRSVLAYFVQERVVTVIHPQIGRIEAFIQNELTHKAILGFAGEDRS